MRVMLNGEQREVQAGISLARLLDEFGLPRQRVAVELNRAVVRRADWQTTEIHEDDTIEVIHFVGGG